MNARDKAISECYQLIQAMPPMPDGSDIVEVRNYFDLVVDTLGGLFDAGYNTGFAESTIKILEKGAKK